MSLHLPYWGRVAPAKRFTHPLDLGLFAQHVPRTARILDFGCGYGRLVSELRAAFGFVRLEKGFTLPGLRFPGGEGGRLRAELSQS